MVREAHHVSENGSDPSAQLGLLERDRELALLGDVVERTARGVGGVVLVEGSAGVGKSSLLAAAEAMAARQGLTVLGAQGSELQTALPFGVAHQLLPSVELAAADPGATTDRERRAALLTRLQDQLTDAIFQRRGQAEPTAHLVRVDDAQWADTASLAYLVHLALRVAALPVALVVGVRTDGTALDPALDALRRDESVRILAPRPLSDAAVARLARANWGEQVSDELVAACASTTGGNPFYVCELLRELATVGPAPSADDVATAAPASVLRAVLTRLAALGEPHASLATAVAILGDGMPLAFSARLAGLEAADAESAADALAAAELLSPGEPVALAHPLIASTLRSDLGAFARARAHRRAADVLHEVGAPVEQIAGHLMRSRPEGNDAAAETLREAAALAREHGSPSAAVALLRRAVDEPPSPARHAEILIELARAEAAIADPAATGHLEQALEVVHEPRSRADALIDLARQLAQSGDFPGAVALARRGRAELPDNDTLAARLHAVELGAALLAPSLHVRAAEELAALTRAAADGQPPGDPALLALMAGNVTYGDGDAELATALATEAFAHDALVDNSSHGTSLAFAGSALVDLDRPGVTGPVLAAAVLAARERGAVLTGSIAAHLHARHDLHRGALESALAHAERSLSVYRDGWVETPWAAVTLGWIHVERGDVDAAVEAVVLGEQAGSVGIAHGLLLEARARVALACGDPAGALRDATESAELVGSGYGLVPARGFQSRRLAALAAHQLGDTERAQALVDELLEQLGRVDAPSALGAALSAAAMLVDGERRVGLLHEAVAALDRSDSTLAQVHGQVQLGAAQRRVGDLAAARESLSDGFEQAERLGAQPLVDRARSELWALGVRPRRAARTGVDALTPSERRIAALAAKGLSTPQIAHELYVTRKTVESHLSHIYRKLDIRGRAQLPRDLPAGDEDIAGGELAPA